MNTEKKSIVEKYLDKAKNNKILSFFIIVGIIVIALGSFSSALKNISALIPEWLVSHDTSKLPVNMGEPRTAVREKLGTPNVINKINTKGWAFDTFFAHGLVIGYSNRNEVNKIIATQLRPGTSYKHLIFGVRIGDNVSKCTELWGNPIKWEETPMGYSRVSWEKDDYLIELEVWHENGEDKNFGKYKATTIKQIQLTK